MRKLVCICALVLYVISSNGQDTVGDIFASKTPQEIIAWQKTVGDKWFNDNVDKHLKIGDKMPDLPLGVVINNKTGKTKLSEFRGKLVILDFWGIYCKDCIAAFPHMEQLQNEFGDKIQIFLVNAWDAAETVESHFKKTKNKLPDLPAIMGPRQDILDLFSIRGVPHHVWIDANGIIRIMGAPVNTYFQKILDLLEGRRIENANNAGTSPSFNRDKSYHYLMGRAIDPLKYNSFFAPANKYYHATNGLGPYMSIDIKDTSNNTIRNTYINTDIAELYISAFGEAMKKQSDNTIYTWYDQGQWKASFLKLNVKDTAQYTAVFKRSLDMTDKYQWRSRICYEQITPQPYSLSKRRKLMLDDLNSYFGKKYGLSGELKAEETDCYVLVRTSKIDKVSKKSGLGGYESLIINGKPMIRFSTVSVGQVFKDAISAGVIPSSIFNIDGTVAPFFIDGTNMSYIPGVYAEIVLPDKGKIKSIEDLKRVLKEYDLDVVRKKMLLNYVQLTDKY